MIDTPEAFISSEKILSLFMAFPYLGGLFFIAYVDYFTIAPDKGRFFADANPVSVLVSSLWYFYHLEK